MKILHYALGFPPYRTGGLTKYCMDLMEAQKNKGHEVFLMWPGKFSLAGHFVRFKKGKNVNGIGNLQVINPLPVPLDEGINDVDLYTAECVNPEAYRKFLEELEPDAIHLHTLMGLHKEFIEIAKSLGIKVIFTSHDYFGICPKVTLFRDGKVCNGHCEKCVDCNDSALSLTNIKILQSSIYRALKDSPIVKKLRQKHRSEFFEEQETGKETENCDKIIDQKADNSAKDYEKLREYYLGILSLVDKIHFNSSVTEAAYKQFIPSSIRGEVINITHNNISDNRKKKIFDGKLKITYMAPPKPFKGYNIMKDALDELWKEGIKDFELNIYNQIPNPSEYMNVNGSFEYSQLGQIFENTDVLIAPSIWYETFGFTVLEALSYGVPVMVSTLVGAKDLLDSATYGMIIEPTKDAVKQAVRYIVENREILEEYNRRIVEEMDFENIEKSMEAVTELYEE